MVFQLEQVSLAFSTHFDCTDGFLHVCSHIRVVANCALSMCLTDFQGHLLPLRRVWHLQHSTSCLYHYHSLRQPFGHHQGIRLTSQLIFSTTRRVCLTPMPLNPTPSGPRASKTHAWCFVSTWVLQLNCHRYDVYATYPLLICFTYTRFHP